MTCRQKRLLLIRVTPDYSDGLLAHLANVCTLAGVDFVRYDYQDAASLESYLSANGSFDFLYVAAHGAHHCFAGSATAGPVSRWADFALILCRSQCMAENSVIFMGCCHGGLKKVALILFSLCSQISSVCGPRWTVSICEIPVALHVFLHNLVRNQEEPQIAAERAASSLGITFPYYNRYDMQTDIMIVQAYNYTDDDFLTSEQISERDFGCPACPT